MTTEEINRITGLVMGTQKLQTETELKFNQKSINIALIKLVLAAIVIMLIDKALNPKP